MVVKIYISGISGNKEVKKRQQRVLMILDSKSIKYEVVDITEPGSEEAKEFMQNNSKSLGATVGDANPRHPLPPQLFNDQVYCGDYDLFDLSNEMDEIEMFLKLETSGPSPITNDNNAITIESAKKSEEKQDEPKEEEQPKDDTIEINGEKVNGDERETTPVETVVENKVEEKNVNLENGKADEDAADDES